jgi:hypothetical protein
MQLAQLLYLNQLEHLELSAGSIKQAPVSFMAQLLHHKMKIQFFGQEAHMQQQS